MIEPLISRFWYILNVESQWGVLYTDNWLCVVTKKKTYGGTYARVKTKKYIKLFSIYGYLAVINGFLGKFWPLEMFPLYGFHIFWKILNIQSKYLWNGQFNPLCTVWW